MADARRSIPSNNRFEQVNDKHISVAAIMVCLPGRDTAKRWDDALMPQLLELLLVFFFFLSPHFHPAAAITNVHVLVSSRLRTVACVTTGDAV